MSFFNAALRTGPGDGDTFAEAVDVVLGVEGSAELPWLRSAEASEDVPKCIIQSVRHP